MPVLTRTFLLVAVFGQLAARPVMGDVSFDFPTLDAAALTVWTLNGSATGAPDPLDAADALQLTPEGFGQAGSAFLTNRLDFADDLSFQAHFSSRLAEGVVTDCCGDPPGGEGLALVIHQDPSGPLALGGAGGSLGLETIAPALIIELDTQHTGIFDFGNLGVNGDHVAIDLGTDDRAYPASIVQTGPQPLGLGLNDGQIREFWVDYDGNTRSLQVFGSQSSEKPDAPLLSRTVFLDRLFQGSQLRVGFAGSTGLARSQQLVRSFSLDSRPSTSTAGPPAPQPPDFGHVVPARRVTMDDFSDPSAWTFNGDARAPVATDDRLRLTGNTAGQVGSAFVSDAFELSSDYEFHANFAFQLSLPGGGADVDGPGGHGLAFVLQADPRDAKAIGQSGGGLGVDGIKPQVSVEFDTFDIGAFDDPRNQGTNGTHVAINRSGELLSVAQFPAPGEPGLSPRINDGDPYHAWVDYDGSVMEVFLSPTDERPLQPLLSAPIDLADVFFIPGDEIINRQAVQAPVRFGLTAATGAAINAHDVLSFDLTFGGPELKAGDADRDLDFDQLDLVKVQIAAKYLTGQPATWGEGDWNGAPGGSPGDPPAGDGLFTQVDIVAALVAGTYLTGPYAVVSADRSPADAPMSILHDPITGKLGIDAAAAAGLTSINTVHVPEPATILLMGLGLAAALLMRVHTQS